MIDWNRNLLNFEFSTNRVIDWRMFRLTPGESQHYGSTQLRKSDWIKSLSCLLKCCLTDSPATKSKKFSQSWISTKIWRIIRASELFPVLLPDRFTYAFNIRNKIKFHTSNLTSDFGWFLFSGCVTNSINYRAANKKPARNVNVIHLNMVSPKNYATSSCAT